MKRERLLERLTDALFCLTDDGGVMRPYRSEEAASRVLAKLEESLEDAFANETRLAFLIDCPNIMVRRAGTEGFVIFDTSDGLQTLWKGWNYFKGIDEVMEERAKAVGSEPALKLP